MEVLQVKGLCKAYPKFQLENVSFTMEQGSILGLIGRNGAGKTTTLKALMNIVHADAGEIRCFGLEMHEHEREIKQRIGYAGGAVDYYKRKKIGSLVEVTRRFYENWDEETYRRYRDAFSLDEDKTPSQLSEGMRVKLNLVLALSHRSELLILDEPTSGLDPISREELLEAFRFLRDQGSSILFSTHITSDLEKCADHIAYIANGKLIACEPLDGFLKRHAESGQGKTLDEIMVYYEKESLYDKFAV